MPGNDKNAVSESVAPRRCPFTPACNVAAHDERIVEVARQAQANKAADHMAIKKGGNAAALSLPKPLAELLLKQPTAMTHL